MYDFAQARLNMVQNQIATNRVFNETILKIMTEIPRHEFVSNQWKPVAYLDRRIPLTKEREMLQPDVLARMIQLAEIHRDDNVLDIACGTGYSTAILCHLADHVVGIDDNPTLVNQSVINLDNLGLKNFALKSAPLLLGAPDLAPFQVILVNGMLPADAARNLATQLAKGGRLVAIEEVEGVPRAVLYSNTGHGIIGRTEHFEAYGCNLAGNNF
jgi:protein-L-isoaspartate(D-aspartate) O-methyltransferase